ncbi:MAG: molybdopterin-dependent oxidoreductase [Rhodospirillales bacterium]|nr:molybdopterin-dependent oxidoreductase [Rhodospirillales bacterium]
MAPDGASAREVKRVPTYCYQCVAGPELLTVKVVDGVATEVEPNFKSAEVHPANGKICVKAFGLVQKLYNPHRITTPMKRTNPKKGKDQDPGFVPISWDEALDLIAAKLNELAAKGKVNEQGMPRIAASFGGGGTPTQYMGTFPSFLGAWGPVDFSFGSGQGVKCTHSEHLYGEFWHRAFTVCPDTPYVKLIVSFGANVEASGGVCAVWRHAEARGRGARRIQIEPHLSVTGATSSKWIPIRPRTDPAFMFAMIHAILFEHPRDRLDIPFLKHRSSSPYLVGPNGFFLRDPASGKPLMWDARLDRPILFDAADVDPALEGTFRVAKAYEIGADGQRWDHADVLGVTSFTKMVEHLRQYTPEWAAKICDVPAESIRFVASEYLDAACVGQTIEIEGRTLPLRPVSVQLGKTVNNGWGGYDTCWSRTMLAVLIGGLETPGGTLGTTVRLNRPADNKQASAKPGPDGFMDYPMNPTDKENWIGVPQVRNANRTLIPLVANSPWSQALGPTHLAWLFQQETPPEWPQMQPPDLWFVYRTNPAISFWDTPTISAVMAKFTFTVCFAFTRDETNHMADILLPDCTDMEGLQLIRIGGTKYVEQFWHHQGVALRQPVVPPMEGARDFTWVSTELARRTGLLASYNTYISRGAAGVPLRGPNYDYTLAPDVAYSHEDIWDRSCKAASMEISDGKEERDLAWFKENGFLVKSFSQLDWYLYPTMVERNMRFELPYQERLKRIGLELGNRLHEKNIHWWDAQLEEYAALPEWQDFPAKWENVVVKMGGTPEEYPFWLLTSRSMQFSWGNNVAIQMIREMARNMRGVGGVLMNATRAKEMGIAEGDLVEVRSPLRATKGRVALAQGIRPDTLLIIAQFDHWATPFAKDFESPSLNTVMPISLDLTDSTGSGADVTRVAIKKIGGTR